MTGTQTSAAMGARPSARRYLYALLILLAGVVLAALASLSAHAAESDRIDALHRIPVGETDDVELDAGAVYSVYYERTTDAWPRSWPSVSVVSPAGDRLYTGLSIVDGYDRAGRHGHGMFSLHPESTGSHVVETSGRQGGIVAIGPSVGDGVWGTWITSGLVVAISLACGVGLIIVTAVRRSRYDRAGGTTIGV